MADWPYDEDVADLSQVGVPTWECPGGNCVCHAGGVEVLHEHAILLCAPDGTRMPGARVRVIGPGGVLNDTPHADGSGWVVFPMRVALPHVMVEWAPAALPLVPEMPFSRSVSSSLAHGVRWS